MVPATGLLKGHRIFIGWNGRTIGFGFIFVILQKQLIRGIQIGAVKG